jgi:TatA/E family protein of Tat protein translocase
MPSIGWTELIVILVIILVIFGPKRLPEIGRSLGKGIKEFKKSSSELQEQLTTDEPKAPVVDKTEKVAEPKDTTADSESESSDNSTT